LQAFRTIKCFLGKLEKVSENPDLASEAGKLICDLIARCSSTVSCAFMFVLKIVIIIFDHFYFGRKHLIKYIYK